MSDNAAKRWLSINQFNGSSNAMFFANWTIYSPAWVSSFGFVIKILVWWRDVIREATYQGYKV